MTWRALSIWPYLQVIRLDAEMKVSDDLSLSFTMLRLDEKIPALLFLLREVIPDKQQTVVGPGRCHLPRHRMSSTQGDSRRFTRFKCVTMTWRAIGYPVLATSWDAM